LLSCPGTQETDGSCNGEFGSCSEFSPKGNHPDTRCVQPTKYKQTVLIYTVLTDFFHSKEGSISNAEVDTGE